jgi:plasmid stabilization system protein ParE
MNPSAAPKVVADIDDACQRSGVDPQTGRDRSDLGPGVRSKLTSKYPYIVFFVAGTPHHPDRALILRILHQSRNEELAFRKSGRDRS